MSITLLLITLSLVIILLTTDFDKPINKKDPGVKPEQIDETKKINEMTNENLTVNQEIKKRNKNA